ncbi:MAG TPA: methyltransferase domain-containing protein [Frankiaceae bacterium]|nr:methyltransferase domain-containing protein [Frankiaceae bacterium]
MSSDTRRRPRRGRAQITGGVPYSDAESTLSLLPAAAQGEWLTRHRHLVSGRLLDSGCGNQPYREWYEPLVDHVVALDAVEADGVNVLGFADRLPFRDASFDTVLATEVLEHVENAERAADELFRVLRPGGNVLVTVPYLYPTHEAPHDFRRFTHFGLADLLRRHGFEVLSVDAKGGPGLMLAHYAVLAATRGLGTAAQRPGVRRVLAAPQQSWIRKRRPRGQVASVQGLAGVMSLGYMAAARRPN